MVRAWVWAPLLGLAGCGTEAESADFGLTGLPAFAVVSSDAQASSAVSLLGSELEVLSAPWLASNTTAPGLSATIGGDVAVAATLGFDGAVTVIDRFGVDVLTRIGVPEGQVLGQISLRSRSDQASFSSNPQDVVITAPNQAWVSRFGVNLDPNADPEDQGNDLLGFDPQTMERDGRRIDLSGFDVEVAGPDGPVMARARPASMLRTEGAVWVGLARLFVAGTVAGLRAGPGRVLRVSDDGDVEVLSAPEGLLNCVGVHRSGPVSLFVQCVGLPGRRREASGVFEVDLEGRSLGRVHRPATEAEAIPFYVEPLDEERFVGVRTEGDLDGSACSDGVDRLLLFDWSGQEQELARSRGCALTGLAGSAEELLVADQEVGLRRFVRRDGSWVEEALDLDLPRPVRGVVALQRSL
ncbi:MAG: hypothetical protein AAGD10_20530 [Myxococcota bacterium]